MANKLPDDVWVEVFSYLSMECWYPVFFVCKKWNRCAKRAFDPSSKFPLLKSVIETKAEAFSQLLHCYNIDPRFGNDFPIRTSCRLGFFSLVETLLKDPRIDPTIDQNCPLWIAASKGHLQIVQLLLQDERVNPTDKNCYALHMAYCNGHLDVARELMKDHRVWTHPDSDEIKKILFSPYIFIICVEWNEQTNLHLWRRFLVLLSLHLLFFNPLHFGWKRLELCLFTLNFVEFALLGSLLALFMSLLAQLFVRFNAISSGLCFSLCVIPNKTLPFCSTGIQQPNQCSGTPFEWEPPSLPSLIHFGANGKRIANDICCVRKENILLAWVDNRTIGKVKPFDKAFEFVESGCNFSMNKSGSQFFCFRQDNELFGNRLWACRTGSKDWQIRVLLSEFLFILAPNQSKHKIVHRFFVHQHIHSLEGLRSFSETNTTVSRSV